MTNTEKAAQINALAMQIQILRRIGLGAAHDRDVRLMHALTADRATRPSLIERNCVHTAWFLLDTTGAQ